MNDLDAMKKQKNYCLNFIKGVACFGILYMHTSYDCLVNSIIACMVRFAVLIFFMISGYYSFNKNREIVAQKLPRKTKHIAKLCLFSTALYIVWGGLIAPILTGGAESVNLQLFFGETITVKNVVFWILFNQTLYGGVLWFLFALLYCYIIFWFVNKLNFYKAAYISIPVLISMHILTRGFIQYFHLIDESINIAFYRNFIFMGFPFFMLGNILHKYEDKIVDKITNKKLMILIIAGILMSCFERLFVVLELYIGTVIATICIFVFAIKNPEKKVVPIIEKIGDKYSLIIYITHSIVNVLVYILATTIGFEKNKVFLYIKPFLIFAIIPSLVKICEIIVQLIKNKLQTLRQKNKDKC